MPFGFQNFYQLRNKIVGSTIFIAVAGSLVFFLMGKEGVALSIISGAITGLLNFILMARSIEKFGRKNLRSAHLFKTTGLRFLLLGILIAAFYTKNWFQLFPFIAGLFLIQMVIIFNNIFFKYD